MVGWQALDAGRRSLQCDKSGFLFSDLGSVLPHPADCRFDLQAVELGGRVLHAADGRGLVAGRRGLSAAWRCLT